MSNPWLKWYPSDFRDPRLRLCSLAARGLWIELLGYMHEGEPYGHLTISGSAPTLEDVAALVGRPIGEVRRAYAELEQRQVFSKEETGSIYSRRMVRDKAKADRDRDNGRGGGNPKIMDEVKGGVNPPDNPEVKGGDKAQKLEARNQSKLTYDEKFEEAWQAYPRRDGGNPKPPSAKLFLAAVKAGEDPSVIIEGVKRFALAESRNIGTPYIPQMVKWLRDKRWLDYLGEPASVIKFDVRKHLV